MQIGCFLDLDEEHARKWLQFLANARHQHPRQHLNYGFVERAIGHTPLYVIGTFEDQIRVIALFSLRNQWGRGRSFFDAVAFSGPVFDHPEDLGHFLRELVQHPMLKSVGRITISPYWIGSDAVNIKSTLDKCGWQPSKSSGFRDTGIVDLSGTEEEILASFSKSARREIRRAQRQEVAVRRISNYGDAMEFFNSLGRLRAQRGLETITATEHEAFCKYILTDSSVASIFAAYQENRFLGGLLLYRGAYTAHGRHFASEAEPLKGLSNLRIAPLLWWSGIMWAKCGGCKELDVEGYSENLSSSHPRYNIYKYKSEFRPKMVFRISEYYFVNSTFLNFLSRLLQMKRRIARRIR